ncbi:hypothetical protein BCF11_1006 [Collimonas sp. PA-H2]|nr:hypothetical protein [Collimonas sp. PA-H2]PFH08639.1 hypothetical protein BCF11_1006 [Collimonas sp. PA-H2]
MLARHSNNETTKINGLRTKPMLVTMTSDMVGNIAKQARTTSTPTLQPQI